MLGDVANGPQRAVQIIRRNLGLILVCLLVVPGTALVVSLLQSKEYEASASLLFRDPGLDQKLFGSSFFEPTDDPARVAATNVRLVSLDAVAARTARAMEVPGLTSEDVSDNIEVEALGESDLIEVTAKNGDRQVAADLANTFASEYIAFRRDADRAKVREAQALVQSKLDALTPEEQAGVEGQGLASSARELEILASLQTGNAELVQPAAPPTSAASPKVLRNVALALLLAIALAGGLVLLREQLDRRLKDPTDVRRVIDLPVLAAIPATRGHQGLSSDLAAEGAIAEAFLMLRANLRYFNVDDDIRSILVTSAAPQEGKTTVSLNLARAEAAAGKRVLLIEADLRRPTIARELGIGATTGGLTRVLTGQLSPAKAISSKLGIHVIIAGGLPPNPAELLESERMRKVIQWGEEHYDLVVVDTPPTAVVADAIPLVTAVNGVVVVVRLGQSRRDALQQLRDQLAHIEAPILGVVLNDSAQPRRSDYYGRPSGMMTSTTKPARTERTPNGSTASPSKTGKAAAQGQPTRKA
ncbi:MAG TPA: polysaccharide biosynthesis tyrosine autokinase [Thermoleophilaceae bacterium]|nr:polysaccharide biosynthesis tyrosine autokinase [Thermoleophilaceae bacterium]